MVAPAEDAPDRETAPDAGREAPDSDGERPGFIFELEVSSALLVAAMGGLCVAIFAVLRSSPGMVTRVGIGVLLAVALNPVVTRMERRGWRRGLAVAVVASVMVLAFSAVLTLLAPKAIEQARDFSKELPSTVQDLYHWPVVGPRLARADAAASVERWVKELPARLDDATLSSLADAVLGGALATVIVVVTALAVLLDGESLVRRVAAAAPPDHRESTARIGQILYRTFGSYFAGSLFVAVLNGLVVLTAGLILGVPLAPLAAVWSMLTNLIPQVGGFLGGSFFVLLALTKSPLTALDRGGHLPRLPAGREQRDPARGHRNRREPLAAYHHAGGAHRWRGGRGTRCAGCHASPGRHEGSLPREPGPAPRRAKPLGPAASAAVAASAPPRRLDEREAVVV